MKFPEIGCKIEINCTISPSENPNKITQAISNIFPQMTIETSNFLANAKSTELQSLEKIQEAIHSRQSQRVYRRHLEKNLKNDVTWFYLNKQAAFAKKIIICETPEESPLGPIKITITSSNTDRIIDWLVSEYNET